MKAPIFFSFYKKLGQICFASAATVSLLSVANADTLMDDNTNKNPTERGPSEITQKMFDRIDRDRNQQLNWNELKSTYAVQLDRLEWTEKSVLSKFDHDQNRALDFNEYNNFLTGIRDESLRMENSETQVQGTPSQASNAPQVQYAAVSESSGNTIFITQTDPHYSTLKDEDEEEIEAEQTDEVVKQPRRHDYTEDEVKDKRVYRDMRSDGLSPQEPISESDRNKKKPSKPEDGSGAQ